MVTIADHTNSRFVCQHEWSPSEPPEVPRGAAAPPQRPLQGFLRRRGVATLVARCDVLIFPLIVYLLLLLPSTMMAASLRWRAMLSTRRASCAEDTWKDVGLVWKQPLGFCPVAGCFQASTSTAIRAAMMDYSAHFLSPAFSQAPGAQTLSSLERSCVLSHLWSTLMWCLVEHPS